MIKVVVLTSDSYVWAVEPFSYLFQKYWSELQPVIVAGFSRPQFVLPSNFYFHKIDSIPYPAEKWSDALINVIDTAITDEYFILMLEDYWLTRTVDHRGVMACVEYMMARPNVLRFDLTSDRLYAGGAFDVEAWGSYDIIETPADTPYQFSTQAAIWSKTLMRQLLVPGRTGWETEIYTAPPADMRVLGTRQMPVRYANAILKGKLDWGQINTINRYDREYVTRRIPKQWLTANKP